MSCKVGMEHNIDVIKVELDPYTNTGPALNKFELVHIKQENSCTVNSEFKDMYQIKEEHDSSAVEMSSFSEKRVIAIKQEAQGDADEIWGGPVIKQELEDDEMIRDHGVCLDSVELILGTEDFIGRNSMSVEHVDSHHDDSIFSSLCTLQTKNPENNSSKISGVKYKSEVSKKVSTKPQRKAYECDLCVKSFTRQGHLTEHKRTHTGEKPYQCEICKKNFTQRGNLAQHLRTHPGEKPFKCDFCMKRFTKRAHLMEHRRIHTGEKPYICDMCNRGFSQQGHLVAHTRTHTGDKPYKCHLCNKRFSSNAYLLVHTRSHLDGKPHKCDFCNKSYMQQRELLRHSRNHAGAKPYKCEICHKHFPDHANLARHRRTHAESIHKYVSWKVSNNMEGTLSPALEGHLIDMH
ncbi:zinc finger protein 287-like isoform X2 [Zootermopsis nevadensis]|uniref:zinc finger protein 287-like isoform X2 n=1 Tax=Zootermopsis nevadensis TaxID=136037 RepID=UPI000B8E2AC4|nr:zinc finger protein 287-like isoform X2 [Zootermopsis nevadensis]